MDEAFSAIRKGQDAPQSPPSGLPFDPDPQPDTETGAAAGEMPAEKSGIPDSTETPAPPPYRLPPVSLLKLPHNPRSEDVSEELKQNASKLVETLKSFGVQTRIVDITRGPTVTRYELQPSTGVKISKITGLADDIALNLATAGVRIEAPIPNKPAVGIEVPNRVTDTVTIREVIDSDEFRNAKGALPAAFGRDIAGQITIGDIAAMPHMLIAGTTGSGKSVCVNSIIISLLYRFSPQDLRLIMVDPKMVEMVIYNGIPHLLVPVVTDARKASGALGWAVNEMLKRYATFSEHAVRDIRGYNKLVEKQAAEGAQEGLEPLEHMPYIVVVIDELSDLMMAAPNEVEDAICRIAQMGRAAGINLIVATQRPSVDVVTGLIKANIPSRIALTVSSQIDSRTIIDTGGAEKLLGHGDMLYAPVGKKPLRVQGCFVSDEEVESVVQFIKDNQAEAVQYDQRIIADMEQRAAAETKGKGKGGGDVAEGDSDPLIMEAVDVVLDAGQASTSYLQRRLKVGYARAARLMDELEDRGIVGPQDGSKPRELLITRSQWAEIKDRMENP
ncbi:MAG TPA: DNA translocase FtsK [Candidatus Faecivivens stercoravium]|uniref:DNA translocase FtsK n=1 Tax=Candidatus Faecivivens stercoravium TaxID=2840803 RepID=A0A9D1DXP6_9FIRM|nr:DNA translocase FtsK [Candidatus Faecivivens stercoravium]